MNTLTRSVAAFLSLTIALHSHQQPEAGPHLEATANLTSAEQTFDGDPYLLDIDIVSGELLVSIEQQIVLEHEGREIRFNSEASSATFRVEPSSFLPAIDAALVRLQLPYYPIDSCVVSGGRLGEMGDPIELIHRNRLVRLCCAGCLPKFNKDSDSFIATLDTAVVAAQRDAYPLTDCVVTGEELGGAMGAPTEFVIGNRLVRLCCKGCVRKVRKDPARFLAMIDAARPHDEHEHGEHGGDAHEEARPFAGDPYLLDTDPVSGKKLARVADLIVMEHEGRELRFNDKKSVAAFEKDPAKVLAAVDAALVRLQLAYYPTDTCIVSGEKLGSMGDPVEVIHRNRLVRLCCKGCLAKFHKDPDSYIAKLEVAATEAQLESYPLQTCVVTDEELGGEMGEPVDLLIGYRLVRLCCAGCEPRVRRDPLKYLALIDAAIKAQSKPNSPKGHKGHEEGHGGGI
ncbi:YHS domain protein [Planctomycetes bacterium Pla163]|uniref:YHS domain protein n=1 Tax=Rohdeia mirabilis TaxID=2528008 RepID=A0A518CUM6_9BACT|nr:YHS domain protein [Planctomycetes bacterium Pla163]